MPFVALVVALLMVSRFDYRHVINVYLLGRRPVGYVMAALALLIVLVLQAQLTIAVGMCLYAMSGPARRLTHLWRRPEPAPTRCPDTDVRRDDARIGKTG
jgi:phosphatidylserine synthase